jgi:hypothetical protein
MIAPKKDLEDTPGKSIAVRSCKPHWPPARSARRLSAAARSASLRLIMPRKRDLKFANSRASSDGYSRFFRIMHSSAYMAELAETTLALWHEIETASKSQILKPHDLLFYAMSGSTPEGNLGEMECVLANLGVLYQR